MDCHTTRRYWHLYYDSEGDAELHQRVNAHLALCPACAQWFERRSRLEDRLAEKLAGSEATEALWQSVERRSGLKPVAGRRRWALAGLAAAAALALAFFGAIATSRSSNICEAGPASRSAALRAPTAASRWRGQVWHARNSRLPTWWAG